MRRSLVLSVPMALAWMPLTANVSLESFGVGFVLSFAILTLLFYGEQDANVTWRRLPGQAAAAVLYLLILFRDIYLSSVDVAKRVINPTMPLNPGIIAVSTQLEAADDPT